MAENLNNITERQAIEARQKYVTAFNQTMIKIWKEKITLLEVLTLAGDLTQYARRDNVLVIRTVDGKRTYQRLNLQDSSIFSSPYFYMQQDDVVYVEPNKIKIDNSKYNQFNAYKLTMVSTIVSMASVIASLVIALTVK